MDMHYRIGEFSRLGGVSIKALRFYDQIGLLKPAAVNPRTQYRFYIARQLQDLAAICALKDLGASLEDIRRVLGGTETGQARRKLMEKLRRRAERSMAAARRSLTWIDAALEGSIDDHRQVPVVVKQRPAIQVASIRAQVKSYSEIELLERDLQRSIVPGLAGGLHGVLWHRCTEHGSIEGEPFVEVGTRVPRSGAYELKELPAAALATAYCEPDQHDAERTYEALDRWVRLHDYRLIGPKREIYVGQILEIQFPVTPV
jgi:DNA-binding transcriptional MerR regulator